ncbi:WD40 repeat-like protein, partial [Rhizopogon vinicolor AM-OR11-026]
MCKWNCDTGRLVGEPWKGDGGPIQTLALSPDGKTVACGREDGSVRRCDTDGNMIKSIWTGHSAWALSWSHCGGHIASGSSDGTILIREAESGKVAVGPIETNQGIVGSLAYSPLGDRIASGGDNTICIWDSNTGNLLIGLIKNLHYRVESVVWSLDGSKLYSASDEFARVFDSVSGTLLHRFKHDNSLYSVTLSPKHNVLACVGNYGLAQLWDTESHKPLGQPFWQEDRKHLSFVLFSRDGQHLAYSGGDKKITLWMWDCDTGCLVGIPERRKIGRITTLALSPDGKTIACGRANGSVERWNTDGKMAQSIWAGHGNWVLSLFLAYSPLGDRIASGGKGTICIWDSNTGKPLVSPIK